jgi:K+-transporting ATPase KdpF subunit
LSLLAPIWPPVNIDSDAALKTLQFLETNQSGGTFHAGSSRDYDPCSTSFSSESVLRPSSSRPSTFPLAIACEPASMTLDLALGAIVALGLLVYLVLALIRPERF